MQQIKVIEEWILVEPIKVATKEEVTEGGIVLPPQVTEKKEVVKKAKVAQISDDVENIIKRDKEDPEAKIKYKVGDTVLFYGKTGIPIYGGKYMFLKYDGMLAIESQPEETEEGVVM